LRQYPEVDSATPVVTVDHLGTNDTTPQLTGLVDYPAAPIQVIVDGSRYAAIYCFGIPSFTLEFA
jgi:hypothetical protein